MVISISDKWVLKEENMNEYQSVAVAIFSDIIQNHRPPGMFIQYTDLFICDLTM